MASTGVMVRFKWVVLAMVFCLGLSACDAYSPGEPEMTTPGSIDPFVDHSKRKTIFGEGGLSFFGDEEDSDLWCDSEMRSLAARHSKCKLPNFWGLVEVVQVWQKLLLQDRGLEARSDWHEET